MDTTVGLASLMFSLFFGFISLLGDAGTSQQTLRRLFGFLRIGSLLFPYAMAVSALKAGLSVQERVLLWLLCAFSVVLFFVLWSLASGKLRQHFRNALRATLRNEGE